MFKFLNLLKYHNHQFKLCHLTQFKIMDLNQKETKTESSTHLVVIIDICPDSQLLRKILSEVLRKDPSKQSEITNLIQDEFILQATYLDWISSIIAFCNSHLMLNYRNQLTVIISALDNK